MPVFTFFQMVMSSKIFPLLEIQKQIYKNKIKQPTPPKKTQKDKKQNKKPQLDFFQCWPKQSLMKKKNLEHYCKVIMGKHRVKRVWCEATHTTHLSLLGINGNKSHSIVIRRKVMLKFKISCMSPCQEFIA